MNQILPVIPVSTLIAFVATLLLFVVGYALSISAGFKSDKGKGLRFLLVVPVTNPLGLVLLLSRDLNKALPASIIYLLALMTLPVSGSMTESTERARLQNYVATVESQGISLNPKDLEPPPVPAEQNVWNHPFLELLATAAAHDESGQKQGTYWPTKTNLLTPCFKHPFRHESFTTRKTPKGTRSALLSTHRIHFGGHTSAQHRFCGTILRTCYKTHLPTPGTKSRKSLRPTISKPLTRPHNWKKLSVGQAISTPTSGNRIFPCSSPTSAI